MSEVNTKNPTILFVITQGFWGGAQRYVYDISTALRGRFDVTVAVGEPEGKTDLQHKLERYRSNIDTAQLLHLVRHVSVWRDIRSVFELRKMYKTLKPDIVHLNSSKAGIAGSLAALFLKHKPKIVYTAHGWVFHEPLSSWKKRLYTFFEKNTARIKDAVIVLSKRDADAAQNVLCIPKEKIITIPLGIEESIATKPRLLAREELCKEKHISANKSTAWIGVVANLYKTKGIDVFLHALHTLPPLKNTHVIVIGEGPQRGRLEQQIAAQKLGEQIHLAGYVPHAQSYLSAFDLFVLPSRKEGLPYTLLEAISSEVPVIATDVGGVSELIKHKKTGLLVRPENPKDLGETLVFALNNMKDMRTFATAAKQSLKQTKSRLAEATSDLYQRLAQQKNP